MGERNAKTFRVRVSGRVECLDLIVFLIVSIKNGALIRFISFYFL